MQKQCPRRRSRDCVMEVAKDLMCPICLEFYSHPVILPCSHMMCKQPCADQLFEGNFIRCPVCRDNCYVSGGLSSLPRVITIESIIEKVRAERKKRNGTSHGQTRESSLDDMFSDVTSENRGSDATLGSSTSTSMPISNSPNNFPEGSIPPAALLSSEQSRNLGSVSNVLMSANVSSSSFRPNPSVSSQASSPRDATEETLTEDDNILYQGDDIGSSNISSPQQSLTPFHNYFPPLSNQARDQNLPHSSDDNLFHFTTHIPSNTPTLSQVTETYSVNRRSRRNPGRDGSHNLNSENHSRRHDASVSSTHRLETNSGCVQFSGAGISTSYTFTSDQVVQTSTPRSDLRNIRLCHEQSLANLKACSDSIRALQQSRPFFRNSHDFSLNSSAIESAVGTVTTNSNNRCSNVMDDTNSFLGHMSGILFDSSGSDGSPRIDETDGIQSSSTNYNPQYPYTTEIHDNASCVNSTINQSSCQSETSPITGSASTETGALVCEGGNHNRPSMTTDSGDSQVSSVKMSIQTHLQNLCDIQNQLLFHMNSFTEKAQVGEVQYDKGRFDINKECDSLVAEIENKRHHFLLHIDDERKKRRVETNDTTVAMQRLLASSQELSLFVEEMLESRPQTILTTASSLLDSLSSAVAECQTCLQTSTTSGDDIESDDCNNHLIDTRLQRCLVQELDYLSLPERPMFYVEKCSRNPSSVALVLQPPAFGNPIDHYEITYCSEEQKSLGIEERYYAIMPDDPDIYAGINPEVFPIIFIENLCPSTHYFFCACAVNRKGKSPTSDYVQCKTLTHRDCVVPVPSVVENRCRVGATSVTLTCPSVATVTSHQRVNHCFLQKTHNGAFVWKGAELPSKEEEFTVIKLHPETRYNFAVIAYNERGECQISNVVGLKTLSLEQSILNTV